MKTNGWNHLFWKQRTCRYVMSQMPGRLEWAGGEGGTRRARMHCLVKGHCPSIASGWKWPKSSEKDAWKFQFHGEYDLVSGLLKLKSQKNKIKKNLISTVAKGSGHRVRGPGRRGPLARASWVLGLRQEFEWNSVLGLEWEVKVQIRKLRQSSFPVLRIAQTQRGLGRL